MNTTRRYLARYRHRLGGAGATLLMLPVLGWVWIAAREPVLSVLNGAVPGYLFGGKLFSEPFDRVHAGFVLDQPTIGKWLFWFTVMAVTSLPYAASPRPGASCLRACMVPGAPPGGALSKATVAPMVQS